ncbi:MAG TPA: type II secretion system F family protein [Methanocellaceae archaeon]
MYVLSLKNDGTGNLRASVKSAGIGAIMLASLACGSMAAAVIFIIFSRADLAIFILISIALTPTAVAYQAISAYDRDIEARAPEFFYDLSEQVKASGSIGKALKRVSRHGYGVMSDEVVRVLSEVEDEGYDIASSLQYMARRVNNRYISRSVSVIKEALTSSSNLENILKVVAEEGRLSLSLRKERRAGISASIFVIYLTAIIFLAVTALCITSFVPMSREFQAAAGIGEIPISQIALPYYVLSISVALCSGLTAGAMRDSTIFGGFKDALALLIVTFFVYELIVFPGYDILGAYGL